LEITNEYDGFYFQPTKDEEGVEFNYFKFNEDKDRGDKVEISEMGDKYHIILWKSSENGLPFIDDNYEAILIEPVVYAQHLVSGAIPMYGVIVRKTTESFKFVESYLEKFEDSVKKAIEKLNNLKK
jgi:hypothetical protein